MSLHTQAPARPVTPSGVARRAGATRRRRRLAPYALIAAAVVIVVFSTAYPLARQFVMAFQKFTLAQQFGAPAEWVGFDNFVTTVQDPQTWIVGGRTLAFCILTTLATMALGMALASVMVRCSTPVRIIMQSVLLLIWAIPEMSALTVWRLMLESRFGIVNWLLVQLGAGWAQDFNWLGNGTLLLVVAGSMIVWKGAPFVAFITYATYAQVPEEILEAAQLDGAGTAQRFRHVVLPIITPTLLLVLLLQIIWNLRQFTPVFVLQRASGANLDASDVLGTYIYRLGIGQGDYGVASALAVLVLIGTLIITSWNTRQTFAADKESAA